MRQTITRVMLAASGALLSFIGASVLIAPQAFLAASGVTISTDPSLLSEIKAPGALLMIASVVMLLGGFRTRWADIALTTGALVYGGYGLARVISMVTDGLPSQSLVAATAIELSLAAVLIFLRKARPVTGKPAELQLS